MRLQSVAPLVRLAFLAFSPAFALSVRAAEMELRGEIVDSANGKLVAARVYVRHADGRHFFVESAAERGSAVVYDKTNWINARSFEKHTTISAHPFKAKLPPGQGVKLLSLERLEEMNRRAILAAFPLLTAGLLVGIAMQLQSGSYWEGWTSPKILSVVGLWLVFAILLYVRYAVHVRGKQVAWLTLMAFALLILALGSAHPLLSK